MSLFNIKDIVLCTLQYAHSLYANAYTRSCTCIIQYLQYFVYFDAYTMEYMLENIIHVQYVRTLSIEHVDNKTDCILVHVQYIFLRIIFRRSIFIAAKRSSKRE